MAIQVWPLSRSKRTAKLTRGRTKEKFDYHSPLSHRTRSVYLSAFTRSRMSSNFSAGHMADTFNHGIATPITPKSTQTGTTTTSTITGPPEESPLRIRTLDSSNYRLGGTNARRQVVMSELDEQVPEVPLDWYFKYILPPLPDGINTEMIVNSLKQSKVIKNNKWVGIPEEPRLDKRHEDKVYAGFENVFEEIIAAAKTQKPDLEQQFALKLTPEKNVTSERDSSTKPDAHFTTLEEAARLGRDGGKPSVYNVWDSHEFKKNNEGVNDTMNICVSQIVYDMQQIMALDPCRRFTFGTSINNRAFRLWFCCRGAFLTAEPFDFMNEPEKLVHVFLSFAFASRTDAGWDPSMTCILPTCPTEKRQYKIQVGDKTYVTVKVLSDYAADSPIGRATRVWLVTDEADPSNRQYVLKDVWVDSERATEDEIRSALLIDIEEKCGGDARALVENHLLTPVAFEKLCINTSADDTAGVIMRGGSVPKNLNHLKLIVPQQSGSSKRSRISTQENVVDVVLSGIRARYVQTGDTVRNSARVTHRFHYRIVFFEYARTMYDEKHLSNALGALADVIEALRWIHKSNWVHRDISCGNIYWYECKTAGIDGENRGLLGDLEFAKTRTPSVAHEVHIGTFNFMASEVITGHYLFRPTLNVNLLEDPTQLLKPDVFTQPQFIFNPLHDLESIWWILVYILYFNEDQQNIVDTELANDRAKKALKLFTQEGQTLDRLQFLQTNDELTVEGTCLSPSFKFVITMARAYAAKLHAAYSSYAKHLSAYKEGIFEIHDYLVKALKLAHDDPQVDSIELVGVTRSLKRKFDKMESGRDSGDAFSSKKNKKTKKKTWSPDAMQ
ncbi:hypothetical protein J3R30DRAFT_3703820 [Lentinula aciculospora]|uniref:Fungal-type protein kinase domain-containing protein n=1 Tax=Lentinula aciculospora TaxID=153920 RepID=A0A9W9AA11_9AGAR|nr:hypothetical protein J3R30DRAFT_3703820 [Lentinula aciculospora]